MTITKLNYAIYLTLIGIFLYVGLIIKEYKDEHPDIPVPVLTPLEPEANLPPLPQEDHLLHLGDVTICTECGHTHNCQEWKEWVQDMHYIMYDCQDPDCHINHDLVNDNTNNIPLPDKSLTIPPPDTF